MLVIGLTGGIASGKSTVAHMFARLGVPSFDSDDAVHQLYASKPVIEYYVRNFGAVIHNGAIDRQHLAQHIKTNPYLLTKIEAYIHPLVRQAEQHFRQKHNRFGTGMIIIDNPLLCETNALARYNVTLMAYAPLWLRKKRAFSRPYMTEEKWSMIINHQYRDSLKKKMVDYIISTAHNKSETMRQISGFYHHMLYRLHHET